MKNTYDAVVVGSGLGGLTAAASLAKSNKRVLVVEQHYVPGGCATAFKRKDFIVEVGLHEMDGLYHKDMKNEVFKLLEIRKYLDFIKIPEFFCYKNDGKEFVHPHGDEESIKQLVKSYPEEEKGIRKYFLLMADIMAELPSFPTDLWKQRLMFPIMPIKFPNIVKASKTSLGHWLDKHITNEELKLNLTANLMYYHDDPYTMSLVYWSIAQTSYINGGGHFIKGSSQKLSNHLVHIIEQNGGQVLLGKKVIGIHADKGHATGLCYVDAFNLHDHCISVYANAVISNAAIPLVKDLLPPKEALVLNKHVGQLEPACALLSVYVGFDKELSTLGSTNYSTFFAGNKVSELKDIGASNKGAWQDKGFVFVDYSQIEAELSPKGKSLAVICAVDYLQNWEELSAQAYKHKKEELAQQFLNRLEVEYPGINEHVEYCEVATAKTIKRYTSSPKGTAYGFAQTPKQAGMGRVPIETKVKNLYFAGAWTFPGGGFTGAILSGYICANKVLKKLNKLKKTKEPLKIYNNEVSVKKIQKVAVNTIEITLCKPQGFKYTAGQYAVLELLNPKYTKLDLPHRPLSILSHPSEDHLRFAMRISPSSFKQSVSYLQPGQKCRVFGPMGKFKLQNLGRDKVFLVAGIGITPVLPMLEELKARAYEGKVYLFYSNKSEEYTSYYHELLNFKGIDLVFKPIFTESSGRLNKEYLKVYLRDFKPYMYYLVGTDGFIQQMKAMLLSEQLQEERILCDSFG